MNTHGVDLSFQLSFELAELAIEFYKPLSEYGITGSGGTRIYADGRRFTVCNDARFMSFFYELVRDVPSDHPNFIRDYYVAEKSFKHLEILTFDSLAPGWQMAYLREELNMASAIQLALQYENYTDICVFYSSIHNPFAYNFYLNNRELLTWLARRHSNFLDELIKERSISTYNVTDIEKYESLSKIRRHDTRLSSEIEKISFVENHAIKHLSISNGDRVNAVTKREWQCLQWLAFGKSAEEIGLLLGISRRTVEHYIASLKKKFDCYKINRLIYSAGKQGLLL